MSASTRAGRPSGVPEIAALTPAAANTPTASAEKTATPPSLGVPEALHCLLCSARRAVTVTFVRREATAKLVKTDTRKTTTNIPGRIIATVELHVRLVCPRL